MRVQETDDVNPLADPVLGDLEKLCHQKFQQTRAIWKSGRNCMGMGDYHFSLKSYNRNPCNLFKPAGTGTGTQDGTINW